MMQQKQRTEGNGGSPLPSTLSATQYLTIGVVTARPLQSMRPEAVYLLGLAPSGRRSMRSRLHSIARSLGFSDLEALPWETLRYPQYAALRGYLAAIENAPASVNTTLAALRGIAREAWRLEYLTMEEYARIRDLRAIRGRSLPAGRAATQQELAALLAVCVADPRPDGVRDRAIIALLYAGGLRRNELAGLQFDDYSSIPPAVTIRRGKGRTDRYVPLPTDISEVLKPWFTIRGRNAGLFFYPLSRTGRVLYYRSGVANQDLTARPLSAQAIYDVLQRRRIEAGITSLTPHDLRRTFVGDLLDAGADLSVVQQLAGHASITTTARYDRRGERAKVHAAQLIKLPL